MATFPRIAALRSRLHLPGLYRPGLLLACLLAFAGCGGGDPAGGEVGRGGDPFPRGVVLAGSDVVCMPGSDWSVDEGVWSFRGSADVACAVVRPPSAPLTLVFTPAPDSRGFAFDLTWDGAPFPGTAGVGRTDGPMEVTVPTERLTPGSHVLTLARRPENDDADRHENRFRVIALRLPADGGGVTQAPFPPDVRDRFAYVADLLAHGVTGLDHRRLSGFVFAGAGRWEAELPAAGGTRRISLRPENLSPAPARFAVEVVGEAGGRAETRVAPRSRGTLHLDLPAAEGRPVRLAFSVEGHKGGVFLWGAPRLGAASEGGDGPPPIVLVTLDTTRRDALGVYGGPPGLTPHLDAFAADATVYEDAVATAPWTLPSHASMFTGLYAGRHGAGVGERRLPSAVPVLAEELRRNGYHTAGFAGGKLVSSAFGVARGFDVYHDPEGFETRGDRLTEAVKAELAAVPPGPLFLFVNYFDPHYRYRAPAPFQERAGVAEARAALTTTAWRRAAAGRDEAWRRLTHGEAPVTEAGKRWVTAVYHAEVAFMDAQLGRLFAELKRRGLYDRAWIVVVADHGELLGEGGYLSHAYRLDPELMEVPLLVKAPGQRAGSGADAGGEAGGEAGAGGRRVAALTSVADLFPTLLEAAGVEVPEGLDGRPLGRPGDRSRVYFEEHVSQVHPLPNTHLLLAPHAYGAQSRSSRLLAWDGGQECARRAGGEAAAPSSYGWREVECPDDSAEALEALEKRLGRPDPVEVDPAGAALSDEDREALRALGYL